MGELRPSSIVSDYCLDRLFDPEELYYVPMEELIKRYKKRDLIPTKLYNISKKYKTIEESRQRIIIAPNMEKLQHRYLDSSTYFKPPAKVYYCTKPNLKQNFSTLNEEDESHANDEKENENRIASYEKWLEGRKKMRRDLENMSLNVDYLKRKKDLSEIEKRVLRRMMFSDKDTQTDEVKDKYRARKKSAPKPKIVLPTPIAMQKIEEALGEHKWRLVDLFRDLDKNQDGKLQSDDFKKRCTQLGITEAMIDELLMAYGSSTKKLNYKVLAKGRNDLAKDKRVLIREGASLSDFNSNSTSSDGLKLKSTLVKSKSSLKSHFTDSILENTTENKPRVIIKSQPSISDTQIHEPKPINEKEAARIIEVQSYSPRESRASKQSDQSSTFLRVPAIDERREIYPTMITTSRGTSAPTFYTVRYASKASIIRRETEKFTIADALADFRRKNKENAENLKKPNSSIDLTDKQLRAFEHPEDTEKSKIISTLKEKRRKEIQLEKLEIKLERERKKKAELQKIK